jgi:hypothetical protein
MTTANETVSSRIDIRYKADARAGWVPEGWDVFEFYPAGQLSETWRARMADYEINPTVASSEFVLEFPPGTRAIDMRDLNDVKEYIVREGGRKRMILREDLGASYEQLLNSDPGEAHGRRRSTSLPWHVIVPVGIAVGAGALLAWRRGWLSRKVA